MTLQHVKSMEFLLQVRTTLNNMIDQVNTNAAQLAAGLTATGFNGSDMAFQLHDDADPTKVLMFDASGIAAGSSQLLSAPNASGTIALDNVFTTTTKGLVPASGGDTTQFLRADGKFVGPPTRVNLHPPPGEYIGCALVSSTGNLTYKAVADTLVLYPIAFPGDISFTQLSTYVAVAGAANFRFVIYSSGAFGRPNQLIWSSPNPISMGAVGEKLTVPLSLTFNGGSTYWVGVQTDVTNAAALQTWGAAQCTPFINGGVPVGTNMARCSLIGAAPWASGVPGGWVYAGAQVSPIVPPAIWLVAA